MMKKALDQTVRELKREVNKKFLKVPTIEQKTLDATSNEPWGTRGPLMAEIAQASCNYNDYQLIMAVLWKRIQDTGKNWRHVYKALIVLEYLVIYGSERVIDDVRERAYQISTLSDFLYTDSNGRDQGSNVRRKAQILVALVNDKKRLYEVRHKAQSYKAKVSLPPLSSSARFIDEGGNREDDNYKVRANVASTYRSKCQSVDGYTNNSFDDYDRHSTRIDTSPSYEVATNDSWSTVQNKGRIAEMASMQKASSPSGLKETSSSGTNQAPESVASESAQAHEKEVASLDEFDPRGSVSAASTVESSGLELDIFGFSAVDYTDSSVSMRVISTSIPDDDMLTNSGLDAAFVASTTHAVPSEPYENPFGYPPSNAFLCMDFPSETNTSLSVSTAEIHLPVEKGMEAAQSHDFVNTLGGPIYAPDVANAQHFLAEPHSYASEFSAANSSNDILDGILPWTGPVASVSFQETEPTGKSLFLSQQRLSAYSASHAQNSSETGSADLQIDQINPFELPEPSNHLAGLRNPFDFQTFQPPSPGEINTNQMNYAENTSQISLRTDSHVAQINTLNQPGLLAPQTSQMASLPFHKAQIASINNPASSQAAQQAISSNIHTSKSSSTPHSARPDLIISSFSNPQTSNKKFEPKSIIWADSISRGLVDLNISGPRINPLADIGIDFNDINRKEKRNEAKSSQTPLSSSSFMGKAMGAGSGLGRAATGMYAQPQNTAMEMNQPYMGMGMGANIGMTHPSSGMPRQGPACRGAYNPMNARGGYGQYHPYGHGGHG